MNPTQATQPTTKAYSAGILAIHPGALGDVILLARLLQALRDACTTEGGTSEIRLVAGRERAELLCELGAVDEALDFDALPMEEVFADRPAAECSLPGRIGTCKVLVSCLAAGDRRAESRLAQLLQAERAIFLPVRPPEGFPGHLVDLWAQRIGVTGVSLGAWTVPEEFRSHARSALAGAGAETNAPWALIHPGSGSREKSWPVKRFVKLARSLRAPRGSAMNPVQVLEPVFVVGPTELDWWGREAVALLEAEFPTIVAPPLNVLAGLAAEAAIYIGNDSGPSHLAAAVGTRTIALFGPSNPVHFRPLGRRVRVFHRPRLSEVAVADVLAAMPSLDRS